MFTKCNKKIDFREGLSIPDVLSDQNLKQNAIFLLPQIKTMVSWLGNVLLAASLSMITKIRTLSVVMTCLGISTASLAAESDQILFSNPLIRDTASPLKLQSLRFVTVDGFAPFSFFDPNGTLRGIHVDLARDICAKLKLTNACTLQVAAFEDVENLIVSGQADIALAGLVPSAQNRKSLDFSVPYFRYPSKFLVQKNQPLKDGMVIGVVKESLHQKMAQALFANYKITSFDTDQNALSALKAGTISAFFGDGLQLALKESEDPSLTCCSLQPENYFLPTIRPDGLTATTSNSKSELLAAVNTALRQMAADGSLDEIYLRYMPINPLN